MCLPINTVVHSSPYGSEATSTSQPTDPTAEKYVPHTISGPHTTNTSGSPRPRFFNRNGGAVYATDSTNPTSANASTGQPRASVSTTRIAKSARLTARMAVSRVRRLTIPDSTGCGAYNARG